MKYETEFYKLLKLAVIDFHSSQNKKSHPPKGYYINYWPISSIS